MNTKAFLKTAKVLGLCILASIAVCGIIRLVPVEYIGGAFTLAAVVLAAKAYYETEKEKLEALDRLNTISKE